VDIKSLIHKNIFQNVAFYGDWRAKNGIFLSSVEKILVFQSQIRLNLLVQTKISACSRKKNGQHVI